MSKPMFLTKGGYRQGTFSTHLLYPCQHPRLAPHLVTFHQQHYHHSEQCSRYQIQSHCKSDSGCLPGFCLRPLGGDIHLNRLAPLFLQTKPGQHDTTPDFENRKHQLANAWTQSWMKQPDHHSVAKESYRSTGMYDLRYWCSTHYPQQKRLGVLSAKVPWQSLWNTLSSFPDTCLDGFQCSPTDRCHLYIALYSPCPAPATHRPHYCQGMSPQVFRFLFRPLENCSQHLKDCLKHNPNQVYLYSVTFHEFNWWR